MCNSFQGRAEFASLVEDTVFHSDGTIWRKCMPTRAEKLNEIGPSFFINSYTVVSLDVTPAMFADQIKNGSYKPSVIALMYQCRDLMIERLVHAPSIKTEHIAQLDRTGRCKIASEHWDLCDAEAKRSLLNDVHHFVRSCAELSQAGMISVNHIQ